MPVPSSISDLSQTAGSNSPAGSESPTTADEYLRQWAAFIAGLRDGKGFSDPVQLTSAATTNIGGQNSPFVEITGTTTITSFGTSYEGPRFLRFTGALTLTHNSTSLNLPGAANITTVAGDTCIAIPNQAGNGWNVVQFQRAAFSLSTAGSASAARTAVDGSVPSFSAYQTGAQALSAGVTTKVTLAGVEYDRTSAFDNATNYRFQPTVAGEYHFDWRAQVSATTVLLTELRKTGTAVAQGSYSGTAVLNPISTGSRKLYLNGSSDYVELWINSSVAGNTVGTVAASGLTGVLVRAA